MDLYQRQTELEQEYSDRSLALGIQAMQKAIDEGRAADTNTGRKLVATSCVVVAEALQRMMADKTAGKGGKYRSLMRDVHPDIQAVIGLRVCLNGAAMFGQGAQQARVVDTFISIGEAVEAEAIIQSLEAFNPVYEKRTTEYLKSTHTQSTHHRVRTYVAAGENVGLPRTAWSTEDRQGVGRLVCEAVFETGLFEWVDRPAHHGRHTVKVLAPTEPLQDVLHDAVHYAKARVKRPPMLVPPEPWTAERSGGYLTEWLRIRSPRVHLRKADYTEEDLTWLREHLAKAETVRAAANKAQAVPYRVNPAVANLLRRALQEGGVMGLPLRSEPPKPDFPHPEGWDKDQASPAELDLFSTWKSKMRLYYTNEELRKGKLYAAGFAAAELLKFVGDVLYFPTFVDWRGRLYFTPDLNPQSHDFVKAGLEFAEGKRLGDRGLFWLKVHVATCAGYDKHDFPLRAAWTDQNLDLIRHFVQDPLNTPAPDPDQCWVFYAACRSYLEALQLPDPREYICHTPCAMDATCSGLQHWAAILRDPEGGRFTNLVDAPGDTKEDIYREVARKAPETPSMLAAPFPVRKYWETLGISRTMAKRPTMTYVYGAKLLGATDYVYSEIPREYAEPILDENGDVLYGVQLLAVTGAKALREGVALTVPAAAYGMAYLQELVRMNDEPLQWVAPTGMPIRMRYNEQKDKRLSVRSMGITAVLYRSSTKEYAKQNAANAISPNFIHSYDAAHMHTVLTSFAGSIVPIHDSFATHMQDVDAMHHCIRSAFLRLYLDSDPLGSIQAEQYPEKPPKKGSLKIQDVLDSRFFVC